MTVITPQQKRELKAELHSLKPVIIIGSNGVTDSVLQEIDRALEDHELIKIRLADENRIDRTTITAQICKKTHSTLIQSIGKIIAIYRKSQKT